MTSAWEPFRPKGPFPKWPSWRYGPNGQAAVFDKPEDVPPGWAERPDNAFHVSEIRESPIVADTAPDVALNPSIVADSPLRKPITLRRKTPSA